MGYINRTIESAITRALSRGKSVLLLGPRQTGKTTLVKRQAHDLYINFILSDPGRLSDYRTFGSSDTLPNPQKIDSWPEVSLL
jgi:predicted AAA+ superfamily ATPase